MSIFTCGPIKPLVASRPSGSARMNSSAFASLAARSTSSKRAQALAIVLTEIRNRRRAHPEHHNQRTETVHAVCMLIVWPFRDPAALGICRKLLACSRCSLLHCISVDSNRRDGKVAFMIATRALQATCPSTAATGGRDHVPRLTHKNQT